MLHRLTPLLLLGMSLLVACSGDDVAPCTVPADCASGVCRADGTCAPPADADADVVFVPDVQFPDGTSGDASAADGATGEDAGDGGGGDTASADGASGDTSAPVDAADTGEPQVCAPNHDGVVTRAEVPIMPGLQATYAVASDVSFETAGVADAGGVLHWDLAQTFSGEQKVLVQTLDPADFWFGASFADATYAARLSESDDLIGVFRADDDGLYLLGVVSPEDGLLRTELAYDPPAQLLAYPLSVGTTWTSTSSVTGLTDGVWTVATETYEGDVDVAGVLSTPFAEFEVLRAVVSLDRWIGVVLYYEVQHLFVTECFGTVGSIRSDSYESGPEFDTAAEIRRLSP